MLQKMFPKMNLKAVQMDMNLRKKQTNALQNDDCHYRIRVGDFYLPDIDWSLCCSAQASSVFLECFSDNFLIHIVTNLLEQIIFWILF